MAGHVLSVQSAIFGMGAPPLPLAPLNPNLAGAVVLSDAVDACADVTNNSLSARRSYLVLGLVQPPQPYGAQPTDAETTITESTYLAIDDLQQFTNALHTVTSLDLLVNGASVANLYITNDSCAPVLDPTQSLASDGTVTVGSWSAKGSASGIYELSMGAQNNPIFGQWHPSWCPGLMPFLQANPNFLVPSSDPNVPPPGCH